jgi:HD-GYP domain-containing protein (c-di-GMP phosphodiesterase class II)
VTDTRALLSRIAEFRKRLEAMPRLTPGAAPPVAANPAPSPEPPTEAGSRTQAILEYSVRQLGGTPEATPPALSNRARRLLSEAQGLVARMKVVADDPLLAGPPLDVEATRLPADPLAVHYRETAALTEAAVRYACAFPESAAEQARLCEGLEGMIDAARRRFGLLSAALERRRVDEDRIDSLARFLVAVDEADGPIDATPIENLADELLAEDPGRPMRFLAADPTVTQAYLGGPQHPAPVRFVAGHSLNCATVLARIVRLDREWRDRAREVVMAGLLHDVGMLRIDPSMLAHAGPWDLSQRYTMERHAHAGADRIASALPGFGEIVDAAAGHHERMDATGYPKAVAGSQTSALARLLAAADVYVAMCSPRPHRLPHDPRAALTDVMLLAERGKLDRYAAEKLLALGLYPAGTVVELADGTTAVVLAPHDPRGALHTAAKPLVAVLTDGNGHAFPNPKFLDLAGVGGGSVVRTLAPMDRLKRLGRSYPEWV